MIATETLAQGVTDVHSHIINPEFLSALESEGRLMEEGFPLPKYEPGAHLKWMADNCFGDYYTRTGLDLKMRELITFCFLAAQGGCEPQLKGHIAGNYHLGNDKDLLIAVISSNLPFIGYPRTLNALNCIRSVEADCKRLVADGRYYDKSLWIRSSQVSSAASLISNWLQQINFADNNTTGAMKIQVSDGTNTIIYELNETSAAKSLYKMLPLEVKVENYGTNEKIFYPSTTVSYGSDCIEGDCPAGTLALFSPWGNIVMYYGAASRYSGLYILGKATQGAASISRLTGTIRVEAVGGTSGIHSTKAGTTTDASHGYVLNGMIASEGQKGLVIKDGKKIIVKR